MIQRYGIWVNTGFNTIFADGIDWIPRKDAIKTLYTLRARLPETGENGVIYWVDPYTDQHCKATPYFLTGHGWCYQMAHLRDGEDFEETAPDKSQTDKPTETPQRSILTDEDIERILTGVKNGVSGYQLSIAFGVSQSYISRIKHGYRRSKRET